MKRLLPSFLKPLSCLVLSASCLLSALAANPTPDELIQRWIDGSGGKATLDKLKTVVIKGTIEVQAVNASGPFEAVAKSPNKRATRTELQGIGTIREGFDGRIAWTAMPGLGVSEKSGADLARSRREAVFNRELHFKEIYPSLTVIGPGTVGDRKTWILEAKPADGDPVRLHLDATTGLPLRSDETIDGMGGKTQLEVLFEDYRAVNGAQVPHRVRLVKPTEAAFTLKVSEVLQNVPVEDSRFAQPAN